MLTKPDSEQVFLSTVIVLGLLTTFISLNFTFQNEFIIASYYLTGTAVLALIVLIYQVTRSRRKTMAAINLLERELGEEIETLNEEEEDEEEE